MLMTKFIGKPYAGKPHVRFDEGVGKDTFSFPLYSTGKWISILSEQENEINNHKLTYL
jgi:hypothetical protein